MLPEKPLISMGIAHFSNSNFFNLDLYFSNFKNTIKNTILSDKDIETEKKIARMIATKKIYSHLKNG